MKSDSFMKPRLFAVVNMVKECENIADIGTDHAYVPIYLLLNNMAKGALAMDINEGPLMRASENINRFSLNDKIKTRLSDGLSELRDNEVDTVVIAGMGGILINNILKNDKERLTSVKKYILQPMTAVEETRKYLCDNGFEIVDEKLAKEDEKIYTIISASAGKMDVNEEIDYYIGRKLIENKDKLLPEFLDGKIYEYEKAVDSMKNAADQETKLKRERFEYLLCEFKGIKEECAKW